MSRFEVAWPTILKHEGGLVDHPKDPGGITKYGISLRFLRLLGEDGDLDGDGDTDANDISNMSTDQAFALYREHFWERGGYTRISRQRLATKILDIAVNAGAGRAHRIVQQGLNRLGFSLKVDGALGPRSIEALNTAPEAAALSAIRDEQIAFYERVARENPEMSWALRGWIRRARSC